MFYTVEVEKAIKEEKKEGSKDDGGKKSRISVDLDSKHDITYNQLFDKFLTSIAQEGSRKKARILYTWIVICNME